MSDAWTKVDFQSGKVTWIENALQEDMLQVEYPNGLILDMGWYENGYIIYIVRDFEWNNPLARFTTRNVDDLSQLLVKAVTRIETVLKKLNG